MEAISAKRWFAWGLVVFAAYFGVLPAFWPRPRVTVEHAEAVRLGEDLPVTVKVSALHPLFHVSQVRLSLEPRAAAANAGQHPLPPIEAFAEQPVRYGRAHFYRRFTFPMRRRIAVSVPLGERYAGTLQPGGLQGEFQVTYSHARYSLRTIHSEQTTARIPFEVLITRE